MGFLPKNVVTVKRKDFLEAIRKFRLMDDTFFNSCFDGQTDCMELLLRIVMRKPELKVIRMRTQREVPNIYGRAVRFDVFATDGKGTEYNIEVQRSDSGANPKRARFNCSMLDTMSIESGTNWEDFPPTCVIFITEHDTQGCGLPIYHVERTIRELNGKRFEDASEVIYVNATHQDKSPLGWLMHDFLCNDPAEMHYPQLAKRASFFKSDEHGVNEMCKIMEDIEKNGYKKGESAKLLRAVLRQLQRHADYKDIASDNEISIEQVAQIAKENHLAY